MNEELVLAKPSEVENVMQLIYGRAEWLATKNIIQWDREYVASKLAEVTNFVGSGNCYVLKQENKIVVVCILIDQCNKWGYKKNTKYINLLASEVKGKGKWMLDQIVNKCKKDGIEFLRLDCQDQNEMLKSYYKNYGFKQLKRIPHNDFKDRFSRLFQLCIKDKIRKLHIPLSTISEEQVNFLSKSKKR